MNFRNWLVCEENTTAEQNQAIKQLYIVIRDILFDLRNQMKEHGFEEFETTNDFIKFWQEFRKVYRLSKNVKGWKGSKLEIQIPENIKSILRNIIEPFHISFPLEDDEIGGLVVYEGIPTHLPWAKEMEGKSDELRISLKHLLDFERYKGTLQHELQHLIDRGTGINYSQENLLLRTISYQCHPGEIAAYAKEYAYRYYKLFSKDEKLDYNKFKNNFYKKGFIQLNNYLNFGEDIERLVNKYGISGDDREKMLGCYAAFKSSLERSFLYFKNMA